MTCDCSGAALWSFLAGGFVVGAGIVAGQLVILAALGTSAQAVWRLVLREWRKMAAGE